MQVAAEHVADTQPVAGSALDASGSQRGETPAVQSESSVACAQPVASQLSRVQSTPSLQSASESHGPASGEPPSPREPASGITGMGWQPTSGWQY